MRPSATGDSCSEERNAKRQRKLDYYDDEQMLDFKRNLHREVLGSEYFYHYYAG